MRESGPIAGLIDDSIVTNAVHLGVDEPRAEYPLENPFFGRDISDFDDHSVFPNDGGRTTKFSSDEGT
jgi:hypothetical protein